MENPLAKLREMFRANPTLVIGVGAGGALALAYFIANRNAKPTRPDPYPPSYSSGSYYYSPPTGVVPGEVFPYPSPSPVRGGIGPSSERDPILVSPFDKLPAWWRGPGPEPDPGSVPPPSNDQTANVLVGELPYFVNIARAKADAAVY